MASRQEFEKLIYRIESETYPTFSWTWNVPVISMHNKLTFNRFLSLFFDKDKDLAAA